MSKRSEVITDENIDNKLASIGKLFLLDFWNEGCMVCKRITPMLELLAEKYVDKVKLAKINTDENPEIVDRFMIKSLPTLLFVKEGEVLERVSGVRTKTELSMIIEKNI